MPNIIGTIIVGGGRGLAFARWFTERDDFDVDVKALVDINPVTHPRIRARLDQYGWTNTVICSTLTEALARYDVTDAPAVMVLASNRAHAELTEEALAAGRHVFLEKPIAADWADALRIQTAAEHTDRLVMLGFVLRFSPYFQAMQQVAASGRLGRLVMVQFNERLDHNHSSAYRRGWRRYESATGGFLNEKCCHDIDIICWLKQHEARPVSVFSHGGQELFPQKPDGPDRCQDCTELCAFRNNRECLFNQEFHTPDPQMENSCIFKSDADVLNHQSVIIGFSDGAQTIFTITAYSADPDRDFIIHGTEGYLTGSLNAGTFEVTEYRTGKKDVFDYGLHNNQHGGGDFPLMLDFFRCLRSNSPPLSTVADGVLASKICFAAGRSARSGQPVMLDTF